MRKAAFPCGARSARQRRCRRDTAAIGGGEGNFEAAGPVVARGSGAVALARRRRIWRTRAQRGAKEAEGGKGIGSICFPLTARLTGFFFTKKKTDQFFSGEKRKRGWFCPAGDCASFVGGSINQGRSI